MMEALHELVGSVACVVPQGFSPEGAFLERAPSSIDSRSRDR